MNIAIILAGGVGSRMGATIPKQFIEVCEKPIIAHTLDIFENNSNIDCIEVVCVKECIDLLNQIVQQYNYKKVRWITEGGKTFSENWKSAFAANGGTIY